MNPVNIKKMRNINTKLMCINDTKEVSPEDPINAKEILEREFPHKSQFEKS